jgi:hypothetical protein
LKKLESAVEGTTVIEKEMEMRTTKGVAVAEAFEVSRTAYAASDIVPLTLPLGANEGAAAAVQVLSSVLPVVVVLVKAAAVAGALHERAFVAVALLMRPGFDSLSLQRIQTPLALQTVQVITSSRLMCPSLVTVSSYPPRRCLG